MGKSVPCACRAWESGGHADDRLHAYQSAPLCGGRKRGEQKQAVGRSRGGRNTKIHALADAKGRLIAILLTGGEAHDCPEVYGPPTTVYNRFVRWARRGIWENLFRELAANGRSADTQMIDSTHVKAHRSAAGGKRMARPVGKWFLRLA